MKHCQYLWQCSRFWHRDERVEWYMQAGERWGVALLLDQSPPPSTKKLVWMNMLLNDFVYLLFRIQPGLKACVYVLLTSYWMYSWFLYWKPSCYFSDRVGLQCSVTLSFPMQIIHREHEGENATRETETWVEEPEQIDFKGTEECGPDLFVSG